MSHFSKLLPVTLAVVVTGCASIPSGPGVMVLPGTGVPFERFRNDNTICQQYALSQIGGDTGNTHGSSRSMQNRYDMAFVQCMYAKGHRIPVEGSFSDAAPHTAVSAPAAHIPPPPPGTPPAPPETGTPDNK